MENKLKENGFIVIDKPIGITSHDALSEIKKKYHTNKVGHCGTLDPFASGMLIVAINDYTKLLTLLDNSTKTYEGIITLGTKTDTYDKTGKIIETLPVLKYSQKVIEDLIQKKYLGKINQKVPIYSAIKVNGKKLYEYARNNEEVEIPTKAIEIFNFDIKLTSPSEISFNVKVSSGTYIRSIANDLAIDLKTVGHLSSLRRLSINDTKLVKNPQLKFCEVKDILNYKYIELSKQQLIDIKHGKKISLPNQEEIIITTFEKEIIAILEKENVLYKVKRGIS